MDFQHHHQLLILINQDLLELKADGGVENPYPAITKLLSRKDKIGMISNKHSLYVFQNLKEVLWY